MPKFSSINWDLKLEAIGKDSRVFWVAVLALGTLMQTHLGFKEMGFTTFWEVVLVDC